MFKHYISQMQIYIELFKHRTFILLFFVFDDSRLRVFQSAPTGADIRIDRRGCYYCLLLLSVVQIYVL